VQRTRIKIDGIMRVEDAKVAIAAGVDAIGMIFHPPSRRNISIERAREITRQLGPFVTVVAVFVDALASKVMEVAGELALTTVQLHGQEPVERIAQLRKQKLRVIKAIKVDSTFEQQLEKWKGAMGHVGDMIAGLVLDTGGTAQPGGTGVANDWERLGKFADKGAFKGLPPIIAAGGLNAKSVKDVVRKLRPWAVDVSSGVESSLGQKSPEMSRECVAAVRAADFSA
jgi:phosphoribosylanthranilate isomerase